MVVGLVTRTASQAGRTASRQIARRKASSQVYKEPEKYNLPDVDDTFLNPHKVSSSLVISPWSPTDRGVFEAVGLIDIYLVNAESK